MSTLVLHGGMGVSGGILSSSVLRGGVGVILQSSVLRGGVGVILQSSVLCGGVGMILHGGMFFVKIKNRFFVEGWE